MPQPFRLALVGAGMVTRSSHLPAALASDKVQVVALVEPMRQRAEELARWYGIAPAIVPQVQDVLDHIDGAVIATPNDTHMSIALTCLEAGVATLIEKPLASTYAEGAAIVQGRRTCQYSRREQSCRRNAHECCQSPSHQTLPLFACLVGASIRRRSIAGFRG